MGSTGSHCKALQLVTSFLEAALRGCRQTNCSLLNASAHLKTCTDELNDIAIPAGAQQGNLLRSRWTASAGQTSRTCRGWPAADVHAADEMLF